MGYSQLSIGTGQLPIPRRLHDGPGGLPQIFFGASVSALVFHHPDCAYFAVGDVPDIKPGEEE